jgi:hypothetical protein
MDAKKLPAHPRLARYAKEARDLVRRFQAGKSEALERVKKHAPGATRLSDSGARRVVAREYGFKTWPRFAKFINELKRRNSPVAQFEAAVEAVINGRVSTLQRLLRENPTLIRARSLRLHRSTLLHYVGANGVEDFRQKTPPNAVKIAQILLEAGAEIDAVADMYGGATTLELVATSIHPLLAGVQDDLMELLLGRGAALDVSGSLVNGCLANGRPQAAEFLAKRGAKLDVEGAAGAGRLDLVKKFFNDGRTTKPATTQKQLKDAFAWACEYGRTNVVDFLLNKGMAIDAPLKHHGQTGLHWAAFGGHVDTVKLLLKRKAPVNAKDPTFAGTPLGWAIYGWSESPASAKTQGYYDVVRALVEAGATLEREWLDEEARGVPLEKKIRKDSRMLKAVGDLLQ